MQMLVSVAVSLFVLLLGSTSAAQVINACANPSGALRVVSNPTDCKANEASLSWNVQGPQGDMGDPGEPGVEGPLGPEATTFKLFDANGRLLGLPVSFSYSEAKSVVDLWDRNVSAFVQLDIGSGEVRLVNSTLIYVEPNCQGEPFVRVNVAGSVFVNRDPDNGVRHWIARREPVVTIHQVSRQQVNPPCAPSSGIQFVVHADPISLADLEWTYPVPGPLFAVPIPAP